MGVGGFDLFRFDRVVVGFDRVWGAVRSISSCRSIMPNCLIDIDTRSILAQFAMILMLICLSGSVGKARWRSLP